MLREMRDFRVAQVRAKKQRINKLHFASNATKTPPDTQYIASGRGLASTRRNQEERSSVSQENVRKKQPIEVSAIQKRHMDRLNKMKQDKKTNPMGKKALNAW